MDDVRSPLPMAPRRSEAKLRRLTLPTGDWRSESPFASRWFWVLLAAVLLHWYASRWNVEQLSLIGPAAPKPPVPVELLNPKRRPVVMTEHSPVEPLHDDKKPAEFEGEFRNRTDRQTKAEQSGAFREFRAGSTKSAGKTPGQAAKTVRGHGDVEASRIAALGVQDLMPQSAASPNALSDDIAKGTRTVLNTDGVQYAGYLNRITSAVYDGWVANARMAVERLRAEGKQLQSNVYVTKVLVEIDTDGNLRDVRVAESCGIPLLDDAPKKAFWEAQPFTMPPKSMFRGEPTVSLMYELHFEWRTSGFSLGGRAY